MKKIIFIALLFSVIGFAQSPVVKKTVSFYADSIANVQIDRDLFIAGVYMPRGKTVTLKFDLYDGSAWYRMSDSGSDYSITVDSTKNTFIPLPPTKFYSAKTLQMLIGKDRADTLNVVLDLRKY